MDVQILQAVQKEHPEMIGHLQALLAHAQQHPEILPAVQAFCTFGFVQFDAHGQIKWMLADLLRATPKIDEAGRKCAYWALKYSPDNMIQRIVANAGLPSAPSE